MSNEFYCDICNAPMELTRKIGTKESGRNYRQRWFKCTICDFEKKINGGGYYSEVKTPKKYEDIMKKNNERFKA